MGGFEDESEEKKDLDDSGYVQDELSSKQFTEKKCAQLLDLSDDVLLYIFRNCSPMELKALAFSCSRLATLIRDRSLWQHVDARAVPCGRSRLGWLLEYALNNTTSELHLSGFANEAKECHGQVNRNRKDVEDERREFGDEMGTPGSSSSQPDTAWFPLPRIKGSPCWSEDEEEVPQDKVPDKVPQDKVPENVSQRSDVPKTLGTCPGPIFTLSGRILDRLRGICNLTSLSLENININCNTTSLHQFPSTLKNLSLRGTKCFNLPLNKSFLFKIHDCLPELESIDVSECYWMEPASLLPLSKATKLKRLSAANCQRFGECVAYASLAARYGFKELKYLDLRGSPLADSEVTALGWLPLLEELHLSAPAPPTDRKEHCHYKDDLLPLAKEMDDWEIDAPQCFRMVLKRSKIRHNRMEGENAGCSSKMETDWTNKISQATQESYKKIKRTIQNIPSTSEPAKKSNKSSSDDNDDDDKPSSTNDGESVRDKLNIRFGKRKHVPNSSDADDDDDDHQSMPNGTTSNPGTSKETENTGKKRKSNTSGMCKKPHTKSKKRKSGNYNLAEDSDTDSDDEINASVISLFDNAHNGNTERDGNNTDRDGNNTERDNNCQNRVLRAREHMLCVSIGHQISNVYQLNLNNRIREAIHVIRTNNNFQTLLPVQIVDPSTLITDSGVRAFGYSDNQNVNFFHIGPPGPEGSFRPKKSNLRRLTITGYSNITNRSLEHLVTAAPRLEYIDFSNTRVNEVGVEAFKALRSDVEIIFGNDLNK